MMAPSGTRPFKPELAHGAIGQRARTTTHSVHTCWQHHVWCCKATPGMQRGCQESAPGDTDKHLHTSDADDRIINDGSSCQAKPLKASKALMSKHDCTKHTGTRK